MQEPRDELKEQLVRVGKKVSVTAMGLTLVLAITPYIIGLSVLSFIFGSSFVSFCVFVVTIIWAGMLISAAKRYIKE